LPEITVGDRDHSLIEWILGNCPGMPLQESR
jgi:hypothetical protein